MQSKQTNSNDRRASYTAPECETCESAHSADEPVLPKRGLLSALRLYVHYLSIAVRSAMQYKTSFFLYPECVQVRSAVDERHWLGPHRVSGCGQV